MALRSLRYAFTFNYKVSPYWHLSWGKISSLILLPKMLYNQIELCNKPQTLIIYVSEYTFCPSIMSWFFLFCFLFFFLVGWVLSRTNTVMVIYVDLWGKTSDVPPCIISGKSQHLNRTIGTWVEPLIFHFFHRKECLLF